MDKIRVLHIVPDFGTGGAERLVAHLLKHTDHEKFEISAISLFRMGTYLEKVLEKEGVKVTYLDKQRGIDLRMFRRLSQELKRQRPHIVHTHRYVLRYALPGMILNKIPGRLHTLHSIAEKEVDEIGKKIHKFAFRRGVTPVAIANEVERSVHRVYKVDYVPIIPNGIPVEEYRQPSIGREEWRALLGIGDDDFLFLNVGRMSEAKNHKLLIHTFAEVVLTHPNAKLLIAGEGHLHEELVELRNSLQLEASVLFLGYRTDVPEMLNASDVFVLSSDWEGNPLCIMEAMAAGKPVISTGAGGVPELVDDGVNGHIVPVGNKVELTRAMNMMISNSALRKRYSFEATSKALNKFDLSWVVKSYENLYEQLLYKKNS